ncbi:MAG: hypothetical protein WCY59_08890 [Anaerovoracaceae bacterium]|jgi:hypothetical protein
MANGNIENGSKFLTWKWLSVTLVGILILLCGWSMGGTFSDVKADMKSLQEKKLDKETYYRDISRIEKTMGDMDLKLDRLLNKVGK